MTLFSYILCAFLILCALVVAINKDVLTSIIIYQCSSLVMCIIWIILESPDLAITEAAVGAGITTLLFFATFKKIHVINDEKGENKHEDQ